MTELVTEAMIKAALNAYEDAPGVRQFLAMRAALEAALAAAPPAQDDGWRPIKSAPKDRLIEVYAPEREGLNAMISLCEWHPAAGFCICEIRNPTHWREHTPPASEGA